jgi:hypothetical protein
MLERRRLVLTLMLLAACGMLLSGISGLATALRCWPGTDGRVFSVAAQVLVPMAATFAAPGTSGRAVGLVMSGLLIGILASRSVAGFCPAWAAGAPSTGWAPCTPWPCCWHGPCPGPRWWCGWAAGEVCVAGPLCASIRACAAAR